MIIPVLSQRDPRWANKHLGFSASTLDQEGCAVTALAMLINATHPPDEAAAPNQVNAALREANAFTGPARNRVAWPLVFRAYPRLLFDHRVDAPNRPLRPSEKAEIDRRLALDIPVIAYVDASQLEPGLQQHFVLIVAHDPNSKDYLIADPWFADAVSLRRYGPTPEIAICGLILYDLA